MKNKTNYESRNPFVMHRNFSTVTCLKCGGLSHNMRSCNGKRDADKAIPKGGNKAKKENTTNTKTKTKIKTKGKRKIQPL